MAKVGGSGDDLVFKLMLTCWIDDIAEQVHRVPARVLDQSQAHCHRPPGSGRRSIVCRAMWELIGAERCYVIIPFAKRSNFRRQITGGTRRCYSISSSQMP
ncbi:MAG: hypothetical protein NTV68_11910 [Methanomicrobiales archaeon]|nr:hypothetical protein [Methanomicrobiales archaeon]